MKTIVGLCCVLLCASILFAQDKKIKTGLEVEVERARYLLKTGQANADTYSQKCASATSVAFTNGLQITWNAGRINKLQCLNQKIEGYLVLGDEVQHFSSGRLQKYDYTLDWGVNVSLWYFNNQKEVIGIYSDKQNSIKFRIPNLDESKLVIEEAIIPTLDRIDVYRKFYYPEFLLEQFYLEKHSPIGWPLGDFIDLIFNSRQGKIEFITFIKEER